MMTLPSRSSCRATGMRATLSLGQHYSVPLPALIGPSCLCWRRFSPAKSPRAAGRFTPRRRSRQAAAARAARQIVVGDPTGLAAAVEGMHLAIEVSPEPRDRAGVDAGAGRNQEAQRRRRPIDRFERLDSLEHEWDARKHRGAAVGDLARELPRAERLRESDARALPQQRQDEVADRVRVGQRKKIGRPPTNETTAASRPTPRSVSARSIAVHSAARSANVVVVPPERVRTATAPARSQQIR